MDRTHLFLSVLLILAAFDTASVSALTATTEPTSLYGYLSVILILPISRRNSADLARTGYRYAGMIRFTLTPLSRSTRAGNAVTECADSFRITISNELVSVIYVEFDFTTGEVYMFQDQDARQGCYEICAYNSDENMVYGYGFDSTGQWFFHEIPR